MDSLVRTAASPESICPLEAEPSCDIRRWACGPRPVGTPPLHGGIEAIEVDEGHATPLWGFRSDLWGFDGGPGAEVRGALGEHSRGLGPGQTFLQGVAFR